MLFKSQESSTCRDRREGRETRGVATPDTRLLVSVSEEGKPPIRELSREVDSALVQDLNLRYRR